LSTKGQNPATKKLGKLHFRTASLDLIYKISSQVIEGRNIPDWKKFLSVKENKQAFINFFGDFIVKFNQSNSLVPPGNLYYIAGSFGYPEIAFYDLEHLCTGSHFGTTLSFSRLDGVFYVIPVKYICYCMCFCKA
jgi:hypothetical protein